MPVHHPSTPQPSVVVIGGGTGTAVVLSGLKRYPLSLSAIVSVADSGGSTGRLRDEFGFLPVGDLRQALSALASEPKSRLVRDVLLYRFSQGSGLEGHNLGNLILTALQDMTGSTARAVAVARDIFHLQGDIFPSTTHRVDLVVEYSDGRFVIGEHHLNPQNYGGQTIKRVRLSPKATLYPPARQALEGADLVVIGPGDVFASLLPNLIVSGMRATFKRLHVPVVYVVNLMTSFTQTHKLTAAAHVKIIEQAIDRPVTYVIINQQPVPSAIKAKYRRQHEHPVVDDLGTDPRVLRSPLLQLTKVKAQPGDTVVRSYLRHSPAALARVLYRILKPGQA